MPQKKGAPVRATASRASRAIAAKPGSKSPKHRGYRPEDASSEQPASAKKSRWTSEQREAKGRATARPRGAEPRTARPDRDGDTAGSGRRQSSRPNWEPRPAQSRFDRTQRSARVAGRPERQDRGERFDRADRPARTDRFDRAERPDRADRFDRADRPARADRFDRGDRPARTGDTDRRPRTPASRDAGAARPFRQDREQRPDRFDRPERPARFDGRERPARYDERERPTRAEGSDRRFERPRRDEPRRSAARFDAPRRESFPRHDRTEAPRHDIPEDVVLERLQAEAIEAGDVEGMTFGDLGLGQNIVRALAELGAASPFPIQAATIPQVLAGRDVLGRGRTGSGKTIAFGAPLVERLLQLGKDVAAAEPEGRQKRREMGRAPRALILAPTRELALQIDATVQPIARSVGLFTTQLYGGVPYARQVGALERGVDIIIGTPGRIQDLADRGKLDLSRVVISVLDEADHMCDLGFLEPVQQLLRQTAGGGQKLLFSATLDSGVAALVDEFLVDPSVHEVAGEDQASGTIEHVVLGVDQREKLEVIAELCQARDRVLVFVRTRNFAEELADYLDDAGIDSESLHGDLTQSRRQRALDKFSRGRANVLVATDVAARGIHVDDVALVVQADTPDEYKTYLHRSGRTGRAGKSGTVVTLAIRGRRRRMEDLLRRAEIDAEWIDVHPGDAVLAELGAEGAE